MILERDSAQQILKKLTQVQPYPVVVTNIDGIVLAATDDKKIGMPSEKACSFLRRSSLYAANERKQEEQDIRSICLCQRIVGTVEVQYPVLEPINMDMVQSIAELSATCKYSVSKEKPVSALDNALFQLIGVHPVNNDHIKEVLEELGMDMTIPRTTVYLQVSQENILERSDLKRENRNLIVDHRQYMDSARRFFNQIAQWFQSKHDYVLLDELEQSAVLLISNCFPSIEANEMYLLERCKWLVDLAKNDYRLQLHAVVGITCREYCDYERQYEQLILRMESGRLLYPERNVFLGNSIVLGNMITHSSEKVTKNIVSYVFGRLFESKMRDVLLETLQSYYACNMNMTNTARMLYIHRNTLQHRLNLIEELTGFSVHSADGLLTLRLAMLCHGSLIARYGNAEYISIPNK